MSGLLVNILRRQKLYAFGRKAFDATPIAILSVHRNIYLSSLLGQKHQGTDSPNTAADAKKKAKEDSIKITLIERNDSKMSITTLEEAQKMSRRRDMKLIKIEDLDPKTHRPVYKLISTSDLLAAEEIVHDSKSKSTAKKHEKLLNIGSRIAEHDLSSRLKNITKWSAKGYEVRILIQGTNENDTGVDKVFSSIEETVKQIGGRIVQKVKKGANLKFIIQPPPMASISPDKGGKNS